MESISTNDLDQRIPEIREMFEAGSSVKEVATQLDVGVNILKKFILDSELESMVKNKSYWPWNDEEDNQLRQEVEQGMDFKQIANLHSRSVGAVKTRVKGLELVVENSETKSKSKRRAWTKAELDRVQQLHDQGLNFTQIGQELERSPGSVSAKYKKLQSQPVDVMNLTCPDCNNFRITIVFQCGHGHCHPCSIKTPDCGVCQAPIQFRIALAF